MSRKATFLGGPRDGDVITIEDDIDTISVVEYCLRAGLKGGKEVRQPVYRPVLYRVTQRPGGQWVLIRQAPR